MTHLSRGGQSKKRACPLPAPSHMPGPGAPNFHLQMPPDIVRPAIRGAGVFGKAEAWDFTDWRDRAFLAAVALICVLRFCLFYLRFQDLPGLPLSDDTAEYLDPAASLLNLGRFVNPDGSPWVWRPPGYPLVIAGLFELFGKDNFLAIVAFQNIAFFVCVIVTAYLARLLAGRPAMIIAATLYLADFSTFFYTNTILSESLFGLMLCLGVLFVVRAFQAVSISHWELFLAGLAITGATYIRIASIYLIPVVALLLAAFAYGRRRDWQSSALLIAAFAAPWIVIGGAWYVRNYLVADQFFFTSEQHHLFYQRCLHLIAALENVSKVEAHHLVDKYLGPSRTSAAYLLFILDHFSLFIRQSVGDVIVTLVSPGQWNLQFYVPEFAENRTPLTPLFRDGDLVGVWRELTARSGGQTIVLIGLFVHTAMLYLGVALSVPALFIGWRRANETQRVLIATMILLLCYFLGQLVFWEGSVRFRFPITPYLAVLSGYGYVWLWTARRAGDGGGAKKMRSLGG